MTEQHYFEHRIALHSFQIERTLEALGIPGRVAEGRFERRSGQDSLQFELENAAMPESDSRRSLRQSLLASLTGFDIQLKQTDGRWRIQFNRVEEVAVDFMNVMAEIGRLPAATSLLGWSPDQLPVMLNLHQPENHHILIAGGKKSGKTALLRSLVTSLALHTRQSKLQLIIANSRTHAVYSHSGLDPLGYLPHLLMPVIGNGDELESCLDFLLTEAHYRRDHQVRTPSIVMVVDDLADFITVYDDGLRQKLMELIRLGPESGIHLILSSHKPQSPAISPIWESSILARLVGKTTDAVEAELATDAIDSGAEHLLNDGDFIAAVGDALIPFQAAWLEETDLHFCISQIRAQQGPVLTALDFDPAFQLPAPETDVVVSVQFDTAEAFPPATLPESFQIAQPSPASSLEIDPQIETEEGESSPQVTAEPYISPNIWITPPVDPSPPATIVDEEEIQEIVAPSDEIEHGSFFEAFSTIETDSTIEPVEDIEIETVPDAEPIPENDPIEALFQPKPKPEIEPTAEASAPKHVKPFNIRRSEPKPSAPTPKNGSRLIRRRPVTPNRPKPVQTPAEPDIWASGLIEPDPAPESTPPAEPDLPTELEYEPFED